MAVERTPSGLRDALFDLLDGVRNGTVPPKKAKLQCEIAARIIDTGRLELQTVQAARQGLELAALLGSTAPLGLPPGGEVGTDADA